MHALGQALAGMIKTAIDLRGRTAQEKLFPLPPAAEAAEAPAVPEAMDE